MKRKLWISVFSLLAAAAALGASPSVSGAMCTSKKTCESAGGACFANCSDCCKGLICNGPNQQCSDPGPLGVCS
jgi:hypothetical protein